MTDVTESQARNGNGFLCTKRRLFKRDLKIATQILPAASPAARTTAAGSKKVAKNVAKNVLKTGRKIKSAKPRPLLKCGVPVAVILRAFVRITENLIGLRDLLKPLLCRLVS